MNAVDDYNESIVLNALADKRWDFRTINGIARETKLSRSFIESTLNKHAKFVRQCKVPNKKGETLFTISSRSETLRERLAFWLVLLKKAI